MNTTRFPLLLGAAILGLFALVATEAQASKEYCADGGITVERADLDWKEVRAKCESIASFLGWKELAPKNATSCSVCAPDQVRRAEPPREDRTPEPDRPKVTLPPLPAGVQILKGPEQDTSCATNYPAWAFDAYRFTIDKTSGNCPAPYITTGYDRSFTPGRRTCALCPGSNKPLKWGCCQK